ncbi:MAG: PorT family protein [Bacteroidales bacterium]|nr:PorT family protein [Bacteroidales bacterium]
MKKILLFLIISGSIKFISFSQEINTENDEDTVVNTAFFKKGYDHFIINIQNNRWLNINKPVKQTFISVGCDFYILHQLLRSSNINFSIGLGMTNYNFHNNSLPLDSANYTYFEPIQAGYAYYKNKFSISFIDLPFEINVVTNKNKKDKNLRIALGGKGGYCVSNYIKYKGEDFRNNTSEIVKFKEYNIHNVMKYHLAIYFRITYYKIGFNICYSLTPTFNKNKGVNYIPFSSGITFSIM